MTAKYQDATDTLIGLSGHIIAIDTEGYTPAPWCLSLAVNPGTASVVRAHGTRALQAVAEHVAQPDVLTVMHNALHDLPVLAALGVHPVRFTDTMLMANLIGEEFIGLKKLAGKYLGKDRDSYKDVLEEADDRIAREWLLALIADMPRWPGAKPPEMEKKLRLVDRMLAKDDPQATLRTRWKTCTAREWFEQENWQLGAIPSATLDDVPLDSAIQYAAEDADDTLQMYAKLDHRIESLDLQSSLAADIAIVPMIARMQEVGICADPQHFRDLSELFAVELDNFATELHAMGAPENLESHPDIATWLYQDLRLPCRKKTKGGQPSTDKKVLDALVKNPRIQGRGRAGLELLLQHRQVAKLKGTYSDPMPGFIQADGRLHPQLSLTTVPTGRLAAKNPNILAFPKHSDRGLMIRDGFYAAPGCRLGDWDLDQIEMRVMAIDSGDEIMIAEFNSGVDKHSATASMIFGKPIDQIDKKVERFAAKAVNFGILMGITAWGLLDQFLKNGSTRGSERRYNKITEQWEDRVIPWDLDACQALLDKWHLAYPQASAYITAKHEEAARRGYVRSLLGRCHFIEDIDSEIEYFREEAKRQAQARPIQGGAQEIVRIWMRDVWAALPALRAKGIYVECILQVHDALMFEFQEDAYEAVNAVVLGALSNLQRFTVPITAKGGHGLRWSDL